ncbi:MAG: ABC transporter ATP-binding protein [Solobacterium sp.]|nr:ABC transporter ATP-binding protein [Solobacterium sp.]
MNALEYRHITKHYGSFCLEDLSLQLPQGMILGIVGENGAGKTTALKILLGRVLPDEGEVSLLGESNPRDNKLLRERIGTVMEEAGLPPILKVKEIGNVLKRMYQTYDEEVFRRFTEGKHVDMDRPYGELSKGNKMKVSIACAMSHHPDLLIFDEATSGLDPLARDELLDDLLDFTRDETHSVVLSSHIVSDLEKACDYIAFLHEGKLLLAEEKDVLKEQYVRIHVSNEAAESYKSDSIFGKRITPYGTDLIVRREAADEGEPVSIEDLFIFMARKENA